MKRLLVVEDNSANMYLVDFLLTQAGYRVFQATTGEEGVSMALTERPDLILMDIQLPGIDGFEATRRIRGAEGGKGLMVVALTSFAMSGDRERALAAGCDGYLEKPSNPETFVPDVRHFLGP